MLRFKKKSNKLSILAGLFFIGLLFIILFFIGDNASLLKQNIANWPKVRAEVTSVERNIVCETPERSGACYSVFIIKYLYSVNGEKYMNQTEQMYTTNYVPGKVLEVHYKKDNPRFSFVKGKFPEKFELYLPLISGLVIVFSVIVLYLTLIRER